jgi:hypothetical protein
MRTATSAVRAVFRIAAQWKLVIILGRILFSDRTVARLLQPRPVVAERAVRSLFFLYFSQASRAVRAAFASAEKGLPVPISAPFCSPHVAQAFHFNGLFGFRKPEVSPLELKVPRER